MIGCIKNDVNCKNLQLNLYEGFLTLSIFII